MEPETTIKPDVPEEGGREDGLKKITQTFESSTAVITFSGTALGIDSDSLSSSDNDDDALNDRHRDCLSGKKEQHSTHSIKPDLVPTQPANWKEESWKSDSGFNSDTPMSQGDLKGECNHNIDKNTTASNHYSPAKGTKRHQPKTACTDNNSSHPSSALSTPIPEEKHNSFTTSSESVTKETTSLEGSSPRSNSSEKSLQRERFNPFNRVPFIEDDHFDTTSSFPSVSGTSFAGYKDDFGKLDELKQCAPFALNPQYPFCRDLTDGLQPSKELFPSLQALEEPRPCWIVTGVSYLTL